MGSSQSVSAGSSGSSSYQSGVPEEESLPNHEYSHPSQDYDFDHEHSHPTQDSDFNHEDSHLSQDYDLAFDLQLAEVMEASRAEEVFAAWEIENLEERIHAVLLAKVLERQQEEEQRMRRETCRICTEDRLSLQEMMTVQPCEHRFCIQCMRHNAEVRVKEGAVEVRCPSENCLAVLDYEACTELLSKGSIQLLEKNRVEQSIPAEFKIYCPYKECSEVMDKRLLDAAVPSSSSSSSSPKSCSKSSKKSSSSSPKSCSKSSKKSSSSSWGASSPSASLPAWTSSAPVPSSSDSLPSSSATSTTQSNARASFMVKCLACGNDFCLKCKVPWHFGMSCPEFEKVPAVLRDFDGVKLYKLASRNKWKQCSQCGSMIELTRGCNHVVCRCKYEFCYLCNRKWTSDHAAASKCPFWDEKKLLDPKKSM
ncbi:hypothetical protein SELMODRAFT_415256 [Selaginella moellendorffii]|uniref:RBR-type E3 ubiquitin transferase n=1 Tax=Selaginella moellendorffii TaxID=88036 RepID=D8RVI6_SELML|nr:E3 ubiquitin-protein ligase dbl4 [Selaginella moellendorffii]EFJ23967.1 hypothetical protein SELMODRAFT_415256 [Selaginella moellendorffii]|eukprot:XP_002975182.1 E3 ubiquitin-protein ligase dbl4 [Selaginella moellendorffii]